MLKICKFSQSERLMQDFSCEASTEYLGVSIFEERKFTTGQSLKFVANYQKIYTLKLIKIWTNIEKIREKTQNFPKNFQFSGVWEK